MDLEILKTFLEVNRVKNFGRAAQHLCIAPSTVGARIRQLEKEIGTPLFRRGYHRVELTAAGERLAEYAPNLLNLWQRAHEDVAMSEQTGRRLVVAGGASLWDIFLQHWINRALARDPLLSLRAESSTTRRISQKLERGFVDLAFVFEPPRLGQMRIREVMQVPLVMVTSDAPQPAEQLLTHNYIKVEWGTAFSVTHAEHFPGRPLARTRVNTGRIALNILLDNPGTAYLPQHWVAPYLGERLQRVDDAPRIDLTAYAVYPLRGEHRTLIESLLQEIPPEPQSAYR